jgi:AraC family transcriptional regulator
LSSALRGAGELRAAARAYVRKCFREETQPQVNELAVLLDVRPYALSRLFAIATGEPLSTYLKRLQLGRARRLLRTTDLPLNQVAYVSGFGTRASFYRAFKKACGCTPLEFRMQHRPHRAV